MISPAVRSILLGGRWTPAKLFRNGEQGAWYDPSDFSTMFQDSAGTTPVTAVTQPVGKILDKSGRGNHLTQSTTTQRPLLQQDAGGNYYLNFDGVDDNMASASVTLSAPSKAIVCFGLTKAADPTEAEVLSGSGAVRIEICAPDFQSAAGHKGYSVQVSSAGFSATYTSNLQATSSQVVTGVIDNTTTVAGSQVVLHLNGIATTGTNVTGAAAAAFSDGTFQIGCRAGTNFFTGRLYCGVLRYSNSVLTAANVTLLERYVGERMGIAL